MERPASHLSDIVRWKWLVGLPRDLWLSHNELVRDLIDEFNLEPVSREHLQIQMSAERVIDWDINPWGGRKFPHLHYKGDMYLLNEKQWNVFSNRIIGEFSEKLAKAKTVNFEQLMKLSDALESLPPQGEIKRS